MRELSRDWLVQCVWTHSPQAGTSCPPLHHVQACYFGTHLPMLAICTWLHCFPVQLWLIAYKPVSSFLPPNRKIVFLQLTEVCLCTNFSEGHSEKTKLPLNLLSCLSLDSWDFRTVPGYTCHFLRKLGMLLGKQICFYKIHFHHLHLFLEAVWFWKYCGYCKNLYQHWLHIGH